jgi:hypothetical protein
MIAVEIILSKRVEDTANTTMAIGKSGEAAALETSDQSLDLLNSAAQLTNQQFNSADLVVESTLTALDVNTTEVTGVLGIFKDGVAQVQVLVKHLTNSMYAQEQEDNAKCALETVTMDMLK